MAHELEIAKNGSAKMAVVVNVRNAPPWHGLGVYADREQTAEEMIIKAQLDTLVHLEPIYIKGAKDVDNIPVIGTKITDKQAVVRDDGKIMGVVGMGYTPYQNRDAFTFLDEIVGSGQAIFHSAGSLFGGRQIFVTIALPDDVTVGTDKIKKYVLLSTSHDGSKAITAAVTPIRVVCNNTMRIALAGAKDKFRTRHTKSVNLRISEARETLKLADVYYKRMELEFNKLLDEQMSDIQFEEFTDKLLPAETTKSSNKKDKLMRLFRHGTGIKEVANTKWAAFNAVTEFVDHKRSVRVTGEKDYQDARFDSIINGSGAALRDNAWQLLSV